MNFLAHLFLSRENESLLVGNFLADFVSNRDLFQFPEAVVEGVLLHRKIDTYTDNHPAVRRGVRRLHARHRKYAPVIIDVYYDYFLSKNWTLYNEQPLSVFAKSSYEILLRHLPIMPELLQKRLKNMVRDNWLMSYSHFDGLKKTFGFMKKRVSKPDLLTGAVESLRLYEAQMDEEFKTFFPEVINYVNNEF